MKGLQSTQYLQRRRKRRKKKKKDDEMVARHADKIINKLVY
jgi:hypothetical protein